MQILYCRLYQLILITEYNRKSDALHEKCLIVRKARKDFF